MLSTSTVLRIAAVFIDLVTVTVWIFGGVNKGWTKTSEAVKSIDPVTGIEAIEWKTRFLPGIDFLVAGLLVSAVLVVVSVVIGRRSA